MSDFAVGRLSGIQQMYSGSSTCPRLVLETDFQATPLPTRPIAAFTASSTRRAEGVLTPAMSPLRAGGRHLYAAGRKPTCVQPVGVLPALEIFSEW